MWLASLHRLGRDEDGLAAVEFATLAPVMLVMVLAALDLSGALSNRMAIGHILRAGAQVAMAHPGTAAVQSTMQGAALGFPLAPSGGAAGTLALMAELRCACPEIPQTATACTTVCTGSQPATIAYRLRAEFRQTAHILPDMTFAPVLEVQIR